MEEKRLISEDEVKALLTEKHVTALWEALPHRTQIVVAKECIGLTRSTPAALKAARPRLRARFRRDPTLLMATWWADWSDGFAERWASGEPGTWLDALGVLFRLADEREIFIPTPVLCSLKDAVRQVSDPIPEPMWRWLLPWCEAALALVTLKVIEGKLAMEASALRTRCLAILDREGEAFVLWQGLLQAGEEMQKTKARVGELMDPHTRRLVTLAASAQVKLPEPLHNISGADLGWRLLDLRPEDVEALRDGLAAKVAAPGPGPRKDWMEFLLGLPDRIVPRPPGRDAAALSEEVSRLRGCLREAEGAEPARIAPLLTALGHVLRDRKDASHQHWEIIQENLSFRFVEGIQRGQYLMAEEVRRETCDRGEQGAAVWPGEREPPPREARPEKPDKASREEAHGSQPFAKAGRPPGGTPAPQPSERGTLEAPAPSPGAPPVPLVDQEPLRGKAAGPEPVIVPSGKGPVDEDEALSLPHQPEPKDYKPKLFSPARLNCSELAGWLRKQTHRPPEVWRELMGALLLEQRPEWAYWLAVAGVGEVPAEVFTALRLTVPPRYGAQAVVEVLRHSFEALAPKTELPDRETDLLLATPLVTSSIIMPLAHPSFLLRALAPRLDFLAGFPGLATKLADFSERGRPLPDEVLFGKGVRFAWERRRERLDQRTNEWLEQAVHRSTLYHAATQVWLSWVRQPGDLSERLREASMPEADRRALRDFVKEWRDPGRFEAIVARRNQEVNQRAGRVPIEARALRALQRYANQALMLIEEWLALWSERSAVSSEDSSYAHQVLKEIRSLAHTAIDSLRDYQQHVQPRLLRAGAKMLEATLVGLSGSWADNTSDLTLLQEGPDWENELLLIPGVCRASLEQADHAPITAILSHIESPLEAEAVVRKHLEAGRIGSARRLSEWFCSKESAFDLAAWEERFIDEHRAWVRNAGRTINELRDEIEGAYLKGAITELDRASLGSELERLFTSLDDTENLDAPAEVVAAVSRLRGDLQRKVTQRADEVRLRVDAFLQTNKKARELVPPEIGGRLDAHIQHGELAVAEELLARLEKFAATGEADLLDQFAGMPSPQRFEDFISKLDDLYGHAVDLNLWLRRIRTKRELVFPKVLVPSNEEGNIVNVMEGWNALKRAKRSWGDKAFGSLFRILRWLGFQVDASARFDRITSHGSPNYWKYLRVKASISAPLPRFGFSAHGQHDLVLVWGRLEPENLAVWLEGNADRDRPITVFYFDRWNCLDRRRAIHAARKNRFAPLILDTCLLLWLCQFTAVQRSEALFSIGLAGAPINPYTPEVAGSVPPEMFFGRQDMVEALWSDAGPCIVYGGRQLGKSALLQEVVRRYHRPENDRFVLSTAIKHRRDAWGAVRSLLVDAGILRGGGWKPETIKRDLVRHLENQPARRIVVLLDECDHFLEEDSKQSFRDVALFRDLMVETRRRFKIVFTGLHSVRRFERLPNQPLAHFGEPVCVGPLEPRDAAALIEKPLDVLGYRFVPRELVQRVLAHTGGNPSLVQLFCHKLVEEMLRNRAARIELTPPLTIDEKVIASVYYGMELLQMMRDRFDWTLDLDKRYRAIGYLFAWIALTGDEQTARRGLRPSDVLIRAREVWPKGFSDTNEDALAGLLEELVGLGILLKERGGGYRLRSPNVLRLLGSEDEILEELGRFGDAEFEEPADPHVIHRVFNEWTPSPFTLAQETELLTPQNGLDIVLGSAASGLDLVVPSLRTLHNDMRTDWALSVIDWESVGDAAALVARIRKIWAAHPKDKTGSRILVTGLGSPVRPALEALAEHLRKLRSRKRILRITVPLPSRIAWPLYEEGWWTVPHHGVPVSWVRLRRWRERGLRHWFDDVQRVPSDGKQPTRWLRRSGGYLGPLMAEMERFWSSKGAGVENGSAPQLRALDEIGLSPGTLPVQVLGVIAEYGEPLRRVELAELLGSAELHDEELLARTVQFLLDLDILEGASDCFHVSPMLAELLLALLAEG